jgi:DNA-binding XRE family transcriptional regulator
LVKVFANNKFRTTRIKSGFSIAKLAAAINISKQGLSQIERRCNGITPENARLIVDILGVQFDDIFELVERVGASNE